MLYLFRPRLTCPFTCHFPCCEASPRQCHPVAPGRDQTWQSRVWSWDLPSVTQAERSHCRRGAAGRGSCGDSPTIQLHRSGCHCCPGTHIPSQQGWEVAGARSPAGRAGPCQGIPAEPAPPSLRRLRGAAAVRPWGSTAPRCRFYKIFIAK